MSKPNTDPRIVFLDLETSGLDPSKSTILEIGIVLVSRRLRDVPGGRFSRTVAIGDRLIPSLDPEVREMHEKNGLLADCQRSGEQLMAVERAVISFLEAHDFDERDKIVIGGFSPSFDHMFVREGMPDLAERLSHRTFDMSTLRDLVRRLIGQDVYAWQEAIHAPFPEAKIHRALPDCDAAIRELREYVKFFDLDAMREAIASIGGVNA